ncbi:MAG TPA: single-stranded DNA-binding protein [Telluria sp.]
MNGNNSLIVDVREAKIESKTGVSRKSGKPYRIDEQTAFVTLPNGETRRITLSHEEGDAPLPVGQYQPKASAYWVGDFGALSISTRAKHWEPVAVAKATTRAVA